MEKRGWHTRAGRKHPFHPFSLHTLHAVAHPIHQSAAIIYTKAGGVPSAFSDSPTSLLVGEALGSSALLTFFLWWALSHNYLHLFG